MRKISLLIFILASITCFSIKDTTKIILNIKSIKTDDYFRKKKLLYHFDGNYVHLIFDTHYVDTVSIKVYSGNYGVIKELSSNRYLIHRQEDNVEMLINSNGRPLIIFIECGKDLYIYDTFSNKELDR